VPLIGENFEEIEVELKKIQNLKIDLVEWRVDYFTQEDIILTLKKMRNSLKDKGIIFTLRSFCEGGKSNLNITHRKKICETAIKSGYIDIIDLELSLDESTLKKLIDTAHDSGVDVLVSSHDFVQTPSRELIISTLQRMQDLGADIAKVAYMPNSKDDVISLMLATHHANKILEIPVVGISMSTLGAVSRVACELFGSSITFAKTDKSSADGQIDAEKLAEILDLI
jgi:3-dehydroquinate dehydratase-1